MTSSLPPHITVASRGIGDGKRRGGAGFSGCGFCNSPCLEHSAILGAVFFLGLMTVLNSNTKEKQLIGVGTDSRG